MSGQRGQLSGPELQTVYAPARRLSHPIQLLDPKIVSTDSNGLLVRGTGKCWRIRLVKPKLLPEFHPVTEATLRSLISKDCESLSWFVDRNRLQFCGPDGDTEIKGDRGSKVEVLPAN